MVAATATVTFAPPLAAVCLMVAAVGLMIMRMPARVDKSRCWWELMPRTPEATPRAAALALKGMRRRKRRATLTIARIGTDGSASKLWIGVAGVANPESVADAIAVASGAHLGQRAEPPRLDDTNHWWLSVPAPASDEAEEQSAETGPWWWPWGKAKPSGRDSVAREMMLRGAYNAEGEEMVHFSRYADHLLGKGDAFVLTLSPHSDGLHAKAVAVTSSEQLAESWTEACPLITSRPVSKAMLGMQAVSLSVATVCFVSAWGVLGPSSQTMLGYPRWTALLFAAAIALSAHVAIRAIRAPRMLGALIDHWHLPLGRYAGQRSGLVPAMQLAGWANGGDRTAVEAAGMLAPEPVTLHTDGAYVGEDSDGHKCYIPPRDRQWGVFAVGDPGTGKTTLLLNLLLADAASCVAGEQRTILWIETKGEGARRAADVIRAGGAEPIVLRAADDTGPRLELVNWENPQRAAMTMVSAMQYVFSQDAIRDQSAEALTAAFLSVLECPPELWPRLGYATRPNLMRVAYRLCGGDYATGGAAATRTALVDTPAGHRFAQYMSPPMSKLDSNRALEPPRNKLGSLLAAEHLFEVGSERQWAPLSLLLDKHVPIVLDLSPPASGGAYDSSTAQRLAGMVTFCLWDTIRGMCNGWQDAGRTVAIYSDELRDIAGFSAGGMGDTGAAMEVVSALVDQGRSLGVQLQVATQRPDQLPMTTRNAVRSIGNRFYFRTEQRDTATEGSNDLGDAYSVDEMRAFGVGMCAARIRVQTVAQPAFTLKPQNL